MEVLSEPGRGYIDISSWQTSIEKYEPRIIVVVVDAARELRLESLKYALREVSKPGDKLYLLGILQINNPSTSPAKKVVQGSRIQNILGYKQKADPSKLRVRDSSVIQEEQRKKEAEFEKRLDDPELQKLFASKQVKPEIQIAPGPDRAVVTVRQAVELQAEWVILDRNFNPYKGYFQEKLNCNVILMKTKNEQPVLIKTQRVEIGTGNSPGRYQASLDDQSIDYGPAQILNDVLPRPFFESGGQGGSNLSRQPSLLSAASHASSNSSLQLHLDSLKISTQALDQTSIDGQSPRTELSSTGSSESQGEDVQLDVTPSAQFPAHEITRGEGTTSKLFRKGPTVATDSDKDRQTESGPARTSSELGKVDSEDEFLPTPALSMVGSVGTPTSMNVFHKAPGRPLMPTGDLQPQMHISSSAAPLYRPAPRSACDKASDELMNILNPTPSKPSSSGAPRSLRTLQRSLEEEDLILQSQSSSDSPLGRVNKLGSQNEENRFLLDNPVHSRKNKPRPIVPLCSQCKTPAPVFGGDAIRFTYAALEEATNNFDQENYIAEGGYGFVYKGRLAGGQEIAVKQYKAASSQGDDEFYSEVQVLKHAQHRNLVILIGYCEENDRRLLVYEFVCNKSLDVHLSAKNVNVLEWKWRWKIAVGAARGLRYLHEECRAGCIVHRDMRPNNILLTHDYVPMVGDFGLARSQKSGDEAEETRVIGTLGYLAPEYAESGSITEKADVYSFGVVLLELITGRKAIDATRVRGETCLTEWARPVIDAGDIANIVDPRLRDDYDVEQVNSMVDAAGRCIRKDPAQRPRMSEVLRLLERDANSDSGSISRVNSAIDITGITAEESLNKHARTSVRGMHRERSLESFSSVPHSTGNRASESSKNNNGQLPPPTVEVKSAPRRIKSEKLDSRSSPLQKTKSKSPGRKSRPRTRKQLSYGDMLP